MNPFNGIERTGYGGSPGSMTGPPRNPFNGIERTGGFMEGVIARHPPGIHSMELKVMVYAARLAQSRVEGIHSMELKDHMLSRGRQHVVALYESIQWN